MHFKAVYVQFFAKKSYCFSSSFVPDLQAKSMVPELVTRDSIAKGPYYTE